MSSNVAFALPGTSSRFNNHQRIWENWLSCKQWWRSICEPSCGYFIERVECCCGNKLDWNFSDVKRRFNHDFHVSVYFYIMFSFFKIGNGYLPFIFLIWSIITKWMGWLLNLYVLLFVIMMECKVTFTLFYPCFSLCIDSYSILL